MSGGYFAFYSSQHIFSRMNRSYYCNSYWHHSNKEKCYDFYGHPTSISGHNINGLIAVWYIDITEDIVAFVLAKITSCAKRVKYFV